MVTEIAQITVAEGNEAALEKAMREDGGIAHLSACAGVQMVQFGQGVENPSKFAFVVEWDSVEAHNAAKTSESFKAFSLLLRPWTIGGAMDHFRLS